MTSRQESGRIPSLLLEEGGERRPSHPENTAVIYCSIADDHDLSEKLLKTKNLPEPFCPASSQERLLGKTEPAAPPLLTEGLERWGSARRGVRLGTKGKAQRPRAGWRQGERAALELRRPTGQVRARGPGGRTRAAPESSPEGLPHGQAPRRAVATRGDVPPHTQPPRRPGHALWPLDPCRVARPRWARSFRTTHGTAASRSCPARGEAGGPETRAGRACGAGSRAWPTAPTCPVVTTSSCALVH